MERRVFPLEPAPAPPATTVRSAARPARGPDGERLTIELWADKPQFWLGEPVQLRYVVDNVGTTTASIQYGGDYAGGTRPGGFRAEVTAEDGSTVRDPNPESMNFGGFGGSYSLTPGSRYYDQVSLARFADIEQPGRYRVRVIHHLGWNGPTGWDGSLWTDSDAEDETIPADDPRWAELDLAFVMPSEPEARAVVEATMALPSASDAAEYAGKFRETHADFSAMSFRPYLPALRQHVEQDARVDMMEGIAMMPFPEATQALIELAEHREPEVATAAIEHLLARLPYPAIAEPRMLRIHYARERLSERAWLPEFAAPVRDLGRSWLARESVDDQRLGVQIFEALGTPDDLQRVVDAFDDSVAWGEKQPDPSAPEVEWSHGIVLYALETVVLLGAEVDARPRSAGMIAAYLLRWGSADARPADFDEQVLQWSEHPVHYIRELVLTRTKWRPPALQKIVDERQRERQQRRERLRKGDSDGHDG